jgi:hypothetical protein
MRFMVMHKNDAQMESGGPPPESVMQKMGTYIQSAIQSGVFQDGAGLHRSALRARLTFAGGHRTVRRGPYAGEHELLASFAAIKAESIDQAIEVATRFATAIGDVEIEIGPIVEPWDLGVMPRPANAVQRFLLLRKADAASEAGAPAPTALTELIEQLSRDGIVTSAATLAPSASGARYRKTSGKRAWTDGPFTETKELVAGFSIIDVPSIEAARAWAELYADILGDNEVDVRRVA